MTAGLATLALLLFIYIHDGAIGGLDDSQNSHS